MTQVGVPRPGRIGVVLQGLQCQQRWGWGWRLLHRGQGAHAHVEVVPKHSTQQPRNRERSAKKSRGGSRGVNHRSPACRSRSWGRGSRSRGAAQCSRRAPGGPRRHHLCTAGTAGAAGTARMALTALTWVGRVWPLALWVLPLWVAFDLDGSPCHPTHPTHPWLLGRSAAMAPPTTVPPPPHPPPAATSTPTRCTHGCWGCPADVAPTRVPPPTPHPPNHHPSSRPPTPLAPPTRGGELPGWHDVGPGVRAVVRYWILVDVLPVQPLRIASVPCTTAT